MVTRNYWNRRGSLQMQAEALEIIKSYLYLYCKLSEIDKWENE